MKRGVLISFFIILTFLGCSSSKKPDLSKIQEGDLIFQETGSPQGRALKLMTKSRYTHVGIIFKKEQELYVLEAVQPVKTTNFDSFVARGVDQHFVIKRLKGSKKILKKEKIVEMKNFGKQFLGKDYDRYFEWDNKRIYCTELIWKMYKKVFNIELSPLEKMGDFDLTHPEVKKILKQRYGNNIPYDEKVVSVSTLFASRNLKTVMKYN